MSVQIIKGDCRDVLKTLADESVHCVVTSPPYFGLRDYGMAGQIGLEPAPDAFVSELVAVFREVRRVLRKDGTVWLNLGDSYAAQGGRANAQSMNDMNDVHREQIGPRTPPNGLKTKDLLGIPWRVAFALQADGWYMRQDIIWSKPNPMPESVRDRCTKSHEYIFLLSRSERYFYDQEAIADPNAEMDRPQSERRREQRLSRNVASVNGRGQSSKGIDDGLIASSHVMQTGMTRNKRSVWEVATQPFPEAHFATFPPALIEPCIKAGCPEKACAKCGAPWVRETDKPGTADDAMTAYSRVTIGFSPSCRCDAGTVGGTVLDPFGGAGTTGLVADRLGRNAILIELNEAYAEMSRRRIEGDAPLFAVVHI